MLSSNPHAHGEPSPAHEPIYAALDLGTNNCRLLIARIGKNGRLKVLDSFSRIVRLGQDVSFSGDLSADAMDRTLDALKACRTKIDKYEVSEIRGVATEACRRAGNAKDFIRRAENETGLSIEIISTEEEAKLALAGCAALLRPTTRYALVFDIGGGSTEILWVERKGTEFEVRDWLSLPHGVMNLSEQFGGNRFVEVYFEELVEKLTAKLGALEARNAIAEKLAGGDVQMLSTSGTVTTLAAVHLNLTRYDRSKIDGIDLPTDGIHATVKKLVSMRPSERFAHPCIGTDRTEFIISGCALFEAISRFWPLPALTIADRGVREGIILTLGANA